MLPRQDLSETLICDAPWLVESRAVLFLVIAPLAQLVEHRTLNPQVLGSSPRWCTLRNPRLRPGISLFHDRARALRS